MKEVEHQSLLLTVLKANEQYADGFISKKDLQDARFRLAEIPTNLSDAREHGTLAVALLSQPSGVDPEEVIRYVATAITHHAAINEGILNLNDGIINLDRLPLLYQREWAAQVTLIYEIFGNPFRAVSVDPGWMSWGNGTIPRMAQAIYGDGLFGDLTYLADALEEAGCDNDTLLSHFRGESEHVRGCWALDLLRLF